MNNTLSKFREKLAQLEKQRSEALEMIRKDFPSLFDELFDKSKLINSVSWTQYTPYFMDGDECVFGINADDLEINGINVYGDYEDEDENEVPAVNWFDKVLYERLDSEKELEDFINYTNSEEGKMYKYMASNAKVGGYAYKVNPNYKKEEADIIPEFSHIINSIPDEFLRSLFGDHVKVIIKRDGMIETEDYEHD